MRIAFCLSAALLLSSTATAACPPPLDPAQARQVHEDDGDGLRDYAVRRWLKCGWKAAEPAMHEARAASLAVPPEADADEGDSHAYDDFVYELLRILHSGPDWLDGAHVLSMRAHASDPAPLADLIRMPASPAQVARHFDEGFEAAVAFLRDGPSDIDFLADYALLKGLVWRGDIDGARARAERLALDHAPATLIDDDEREHRQRVLAELRESLAPPVAKSAAVKMKGEPWIVDRSTPREVFCGRAVIDRIYGTTAIRERVLKAADIDAAISDLLVGSGVDQMKYVDATHGELLADLLRRRYGAAGLRQAWDDAIAMMRVDGPVPTLSLFGHQLPLPQAVREDDDASPRGTRDRPFTREELDAFVRASPLYRRSLGLPLTTED